MDSWIDPQRLVEVRAYTGPDTLSYQRGMQRPILVHRVRLLRALKGLRVYTQEVRKVSTTLEPGKLRS